MVSVGGATGAASEMDGGFSCAGGISLVGEILLAIDEWW